MFKTISWQEFLNIALIAVGLYYGISILLFYSKDLVRRFRGDRARPEEIEFGSPDDSTLMGGIKKDAPRKHQQVVDAQDLIIGPSDNSQQTDTEGSLLIGSVSDLLREIKVLARVIKESKGSKEDGAPMFQSLLSNYSHLIGTKYQESISLFIHDQCRSECAFEVDLAEVRSWWLEMESQNNNQ